MVPLHRLPVCPVLIDIGGSRAVTLPFLQSVVYPSLQDALRQIRARRGEEGHLSPHLQDLSDTSVSSWIRPCGFSPDPPLLQHESWESVWQAYMRSVRRRARSVAATAIVAPITGAAPAATEAAETTETSGAGVDALPVIGSSVLPLPLDLFPADVQKVGVKMEFVRVDAFIPVHVQMCHVMRRVMETPSSWDVVAVGVVAPAHQTEYFVNVARHLHEGVAKSPSTTPGAPSVLVYDHMRGLRFQFP